MKPVFDIIPLCFKMKAAIKNSYFLLQVSEFGSQTGKLAEKRWVACGKGKQIAVATQALCLRLSYCGESFHF